VQLEVKVDSIEEQPDEIGRLVARRARFALRRLVALAPRVRVRLWGANGLRGVERRCQVTLETDATGTVVAISRSRDWRAAFDDALARAVRRLARLWRRSWNGGQPVLRALVFRR
jgi:hypothetical protein